ncbi:hypothetical protein PR048_019268 [Dryococelus australis]|uniref:Uncharacterized protein n=1 Tax=Dryococelus australis TaxID=614101 RepID=A0ABQ9H312_9NEOP|nr:hypothetical protein PR048_019268 [Dryococelus australis]
MTNAHDRTARRQEVKFVQGEKVVVRTSHCDIWKPGVIVEQHSSLRSYWGNMVCRNVIHIRKSKVLHVPREVTPVLMEVDYETNSEQLRQSPCSSPSVPDFRGFEPSMSAADECNTTRSGKVVKPVFTCYERDANGILFNTITSHVDGDVIVDRHSFSFYAWYPVERQRFPGHLLVVGTDGCYGCQLPQNRRHLRAEAVPPFPPHSTHLDRKILKQPVASQVPMHAQQHYSVTLLFRVCAIPDEHCSIRVVKSELFGRTRAVLGRVVS